MAHPWVSTITARLGEPLFTTGDEIRFNCFTSDCGGHDGKDEHHHLYVNITRGKYFCQRCGKGGTLEYLASRLGLDSPGKALNQWELIVKEFLYGSPEDTSLGEPVEIDWPEDYHEMIPGTKAFSYLKSRGIHEPMIEFYQIGFGVGSLKNRVIFPDVNNHGELVYWVARDYVHKDARIKYKNATVPSENQIFNLGRLSRWANISDGPRRMIICEGPISAIVAGYDAVATYGKHVPSAKLNRMIAYDAEEYVIAAESDALETAVSLASRLFQRGRKVRFIRMRGEEDPAYIGRAEMRKRVFSAHTWGQMSALQVLL